MDAVAQAATYGGSALDYMEAPDPALFVKEAAGDDRLAVRFFKKAARDAEASAAAGRLVFKEAEYIQIMVPGDRDNILVRPVGEGDKRRFAKHYDQWVKGETDQVVGTPLEIWGKLNLAQVEEFRYFGIRTVEQLAVLNDQVCSRLPGAYNLKAEAAKFIDLLKAEAPLKKVQEELAARDNEMASLKKAIEEQAELIKKLQANAGQVELPKVAKK